MVSCVSKMFEWIGAVVSRFQSISVSLSSNLLDGQSFQWSMVILKYKHCNTEFIRKPDNLVSGSCMVNVIDVMEEPGGT